MNRVAGRAALHPPVGKGGLRCGQGRGVEASYHTIDDLRQGWLPDRADVVIFLTGSAVRKVYQASRHREGGGEVLPLMGGIRSLADRLRWRKDRESGLFHILAPRDPASCLFDYLTGKRPFQSLEDCG